MGKAPAQDEGLQRSTAAGHSNTKGHLPLNRCRVHRLSFVPIEPCSVQISRPLTEWLWSVWTWFRRVLCCGKEREDMEHDSKRDPLLHAA